MGAIYFSHDEDARNDPKLTKIRAKYGMEGYGCFFAILEMFSSESKHILDYSQEQFEAIAYDLHSSLDMKEFIDKCVEVGLYQTDGEHFWSESFLKRATEAEEKSAKRVEKAKKAISMRWDKQRERQKQQEKQENVVVPDEDFSIVDENWLRFVRTYEQNIGLIPHGGTQMGQTLLSYYNDFGADVMCKAVEITNLKQADNPARFLLAILRNWADKKVKTVSDAEAATKDYDRRQQRQRNWKKDQQEQPEQEPAIRGDFY